MALWEGDGVVPIIRSSPCLLPTSIKGMKCSSPLPGGSDNRSIPQSSARQPDPPRSEHAITCSHRASRLFVEENRALDSRKLHDHLYSISGEKRSFGDLSAWSYRRCHLGGFRCANTRKRTSQMGKHHDEDLASDRRRVLTSTLQSVHHRSHSSNDRLPMRVLQANRC